MKTRLPAWLFALGLIAPLTTSSGCKKDTAETTPPGDAQASPEQADAFEGREVVDNWEAKTGDVTVCPMSGKKFEVADNSTRYAYEGYEFVFCCVACEAKIEAKAGEYLDALVEEAGGPRQEPEPEPEPESD